MIRSFGDRFDRVESAILAADWRLTAVRNRNGSPVSSIAALRSSGSAFVH